MALQTPQISQLRQSTGYSGLLVKRGSLLAHLIVFIQQEPQYREMLPPGYGRELFRAVLPGGFRRIPQ